MPNQDPLAPPGAEGPFSRYLNAPLEGQAAEETRPQPRPSGFMGTTGKLAMFGSALLKGLQQGKMKAYAQREQEKAQKFSIAADRVNKAIDNPDLPSEERAELQNLLGQSFGMATKEQVDELKKFHGKKGSGPGSHVLGMIEHVADKLGGSTPAEHSLGGAKDASGVSAYDRLNEKLADLHLGGEKYSVKAQTAALQNQLVQKLKPYKEDYNLRGAETDPEVIALRAKLHGISPEQGKLADEAMRAGLTAPSKDETTEKRYRELLKESGPSRGAADDAAIKPSSPDFSPIRMPNGIIVKSPEDMQLVLSRDGGARTRVLMKSQEPGPNGTTVNVRREGTAYANMPGMVTDVSTGKPFGPNWTAVPQGDHDPAAAKPAFTTIKEQGPGDTMIERKVELKDGVPVQYTPYRVPAKVKAGKAPDPIGQALKEIHLDNATEDLAEKKRKHNAILLTDKIMGDIHKDALTYGKKPSEILDQRIQDFMGYYESDPRFAGNFDTVRENLLKRKAELATSDAKAVAAARTQKKAEQEKAVPKKGDAIKGSPASSTPANSDKQAPPKEVIETLPPGEHTFRNGQVWLKKADGTVVYVRG